MPASKKLLSFSFKLSRYGKLNLSFGSSSLSTWPAQAIQVTLCNLHPATKQPNKQTAQPSKQSRKQAIQLWTKKASNQAKETKQPNHPTQPTPTKPNQHSTRPIHPKQHNKPTQPLPVLTCNWKEGFHSTYFSSNRPSYIWERLCNTYARTVEGECRLELHETRYSISEFSRPTLQNSHKVCRLVDTQVGHVNLGATYTHRHS